MEGINATQSQTVSISSGEKAKGRDIIGAIRTTLSNGPWLIIDTLRPSPRCASWRRVGRPRRNLSIGLIEEMRSKRSQCRRRVIRSYLLSSVGFSLTL